MVVERRAWLLCGAYSTHRTYTIHRCRAVTDTSARNIVNRIAPAVPVPAALPLRKGCHNAGALSVLAALQQRLCLKLRLETWRIEGCGADMVWMTMLVW